MVKADFCALADRFGPRAQRARREGEAWILSSHWDRWAGDKRMRGHWFSSFAQPSEHTKYHEEAPCWLYFVVVGRAEVAWLVTYDLASLAKALSDEFGASRPRMDFQSAASGMVSSSGTLVERRGEVLSRGCNAHPALSLTPSSALPRIPFRSGGILI